MNHYQKEYGAWSKEHKKLLDELQSHQTTLYDRLYPVIKVLDQLTLPNPTDVPHEEEDIIKIFQVGLEFLQDQIQSIEIYFEKVFHQDFHEMLPYETFINYMLYLEDVRYEVSEQGMTQYFDELDELLDEVSEFIEQKKPLPEAYGLYLDERIKSILGDSFETFYSIVDIFLDIADTLGIDLYEAVDYTIGKDL